MHKYVTDDFTLRKKIISDGSHQSLSVDYYYGDLGIVALV